MFTSLNVGGPTGAMFPFLFVTIACGACSGFHGLVCSGTTSKQIDKETHAHPVGYGAMLMEAFVALIALGTIMIVSTAETAGKAPGTIYGEGLGRFLVLVIGQKNLPFAITFGAMAFSTFVFDTLDVSTRLGRYIFQELFGLKHPLAPYFATAATVGIPLVFVFMAQKGAYLMFWTLFGTSNQMLAALSLMGVSVWLKNSGKRYWYTLIPALFVSVITLWSLWLQVVAGFAEQATATQQINSAVSFVLGGLAVTLLLRGSRALLRDSPVQVIGSNAA
jgi:carbon starvation protein